MGIRSGEKVAAVAKNGGNRGERFDGLGVGENGKRAFLGGVRLFRRCSGFLFAFLGKIACFDRFLGENRHIYDIFNLGKRVKHEQMFGFFIKKMAVTSCKNGESM